MEVTDNKRIAKNTLALYFRMGLTMIVGLYTSRVILQVLGVTDMGINATVGGVVTFAGFLNGALSNGTSRFLTVALGKGDESEMKSTFSTCFWVHVGLALVLAILTEFVGLWFLYNKLVIPLDRMDAAVWTFHLCVISSIVSMTQVPYSACLIAHERMDMYAYTTLIDVFLKLLIVYVLTIFDVDKLKLYATLYFLTTTGMTFFYRWFCTTRFKECRVERKFDKDVFKPILQFSGWQLVANASLALSGQGILIILNMFFSPAVVTARSISLQVNNYATQFMTNFRTASNPQIIKKYAAGDYIGSKQLLLESTKFCFYLMLVMSVPIYFLSFILLKLWLGQVPEYTDIFLKLVMIQSLFQIFDTGLYTALYAKGRIKENALTSPVLGIICFVMVYILFRCGFSPISLSWIFIFKYFTLGLIVKPILLIHVVGGYTWNDFFKLFEQCLRVTLISVILPFFCNLFIRQLTNNNLLIFGAICILSIFSVCITVWFVGIEKKMRIKLLVFAKKKISQL